MKHRQQRLAEAASWLRNAALGIFHGVLLYGLFDRAPWAFSTATYVEDWLIAEMIALVVVPYFMLLAARDHEQPLLERVLVLPVILLAMAGISGTVRLLQATWLYVLTCVPVLWAEQTAARAQLGCARSIVKIIVLVVLLLVFGNRPLQWPIGTLAGKWMDPEVRGAANSMAFATFYFAITAGMEYLFWHKIGKAGGDTGSLGKSE